MRIAYVEMIGGVAGDMLLAAFLDAGVDRDEIERRLRTVVADGWTLAPRRVVKCGIDAVYAGLVVPGEDGDDDHHGHRHHDADHRHHRADHLDGARPHQPEHDDFARGTRSLAGVLEIVNASGLTVRQRERASAVYRALAEAEARVDGTTLEALRFHAIGQIDAILDVAATCVALDLLEIDELRCSPFPVGRRSAPATDALLAGRPTREAEVDGELVTPTGAAILVTLGRPGSPPEIVERSGYGAGRSDFPIPNVVRVVIGAA